MFPLTKWVDITRTAMEVICSGWDGCPFKDWACIISRVVKLMGNG